MDNEAHSPLLLKKLNTAYLLQLNRPDVHNAINDQVMQKFESALDQIEADDSGLPVILTHTGDKTFCAGGDLKYFSGLDTPEKCREMSLRMQRILERLENCGHFVILAARGQILGGGCEILTACHYAVIADSCRLSFRQAPNGIITGWGGGRRLIRKVGRAKALRLTLGGEKITAEEALRLMLVEEIVAVEQVLERAQELAQYIAKNDSHAIRGFLDLERGQRTLPNKELIELETDIFVHLWQGERFQEILKRFREGNK